MKKKLALLTLMAIFAHDGFAQQVAFDPQLDSKAVVTTPPRATEWPNAWMWYPGQLAAFYQQQSLAISRSRCVNVGYPGNFFAKSNRVYFQRTVNLKKATMLEWSAPAPAVVALSVDGVECVATTEDQITLSKGKHTLLFEIITSNSLPCILFKDSDLGNPQSWRASLDNINWTIPESSSAFKSPTIYPDNVRAVTASVPATRLVAIRNSEVSGAESCLIKKNGIVLVDFFHLEIGTLTFDAKGCGSVIVRVGESPEEALNSNVKAFEQFPLPPFEISESVSTVELPQRAFRYVAIESTDLAEVSSIRFHTSLWPADYQMTFHCDDDRINNMFAMGGATLHTSMHRFYLDGVKRDFLPWSMDAIASTFAGDYLFGDQQVAKNGISIALMPLNPQPSDLGIPDYPLHALVGLKQNYLRYGDLSTSLQYRERITQLLDFYISIGDENGFVRGSYGDQGFGYVPGWATKNGPDNNGIASYAQVMLYYNYQIGAWFADLWKEPALAKKYRKQAEILKHKIFEHFWDDNAKAFINGMHKNGMIDNRISHHAQYWAVLADLFPEQHYDNLFENVIPNIPYYYTYVSFEKGYELQAYIKAGRVKEMWDLLYRVWGDWMEQGHSRFPENFSPEASREEQLTFYDRPFGLSLCHGANGVPPVVGVLNGLIGFSQSVDRPNQYTITPKLLHLQWVDARFPVKEGFVEVHLKASGESSITIPAGCSVAVQTGSGQKPLVLKKAGQYTFTLIQTN